MVLGTFGMLLAAGAISALADKSRKKANPKLNDAEFDTRCARFGINRVKIMDIAARCGVKPSKYGVLPEDGWKHCLDYVSNYVNSPDDIEQFKHNWANVVKRQLKGKSQQMIDKYWDSYQNSYQLFLENKNNWLNGPIITLELKHWHGLPKDQHIARLKDIQSKTFWSELTLKDPILRNNPRFKDAHTETWVLRGGRYDEQSSRLTRNKMKTLYEKCCGVCGYDAML